MREYGQLPEDKTEQMTKHFMKITGSTNYLKILKKRLIFSFR